MVKGRRVADKTLFQATPIPEESDEYNTFNSFNQRINHSSETSVFGISRQDSTSHNENIQIL
jgi:hypothetical protein